jgi:hypothetical protein
MINLFWTVFCILDFVPQRLYSERQQDFPVAGLDYSEPRVSCTNEITIVITFLSARGYYKRGAACAMLGLMLVIVFYAVIHHRRVRRHVICPGRTHFFFLCVLLNFRF